MIKKVPVISSLATVSDIMKAAMSGRDQPLKEKFAQSLAGFLTLRYAHLTNTGISAFYLLLKALGEISDRKEVILPAYTAGSLVTAVRQAGLKVVLCDISLDDFNMDTASVSGALSSDTLAVVAVHMFGIPMRDIAMLKTKMPAGVFLIEDCAQAMGSKVSGRMVGAFSDASFFSFNRGKNFPLYAGGCLGLPSDVFRSRIEEACRIRLSEANTRDAVDIFWKAIAFALISHPALYGAGYPLIERFRETAPVQNVEPREMTIVQAALGMALLDNIERAFSLRHENGIYLIDALKGAKGITVPRIADSHWSVFNSFPVIFEDAAQMNRVRLKLWKAGIDTSRVYQRPLHHMFDLGYKRDDFPNACLCAERMLALPTHPRVTKKDLVMIAEIVRQ